jgi:hypothetical protein
VVEVGLKAIVFATGTAPGAEQLDLAQAATTDAKVATATTGKVKTLQFQCS